MEQTQLFEPVMAADYKCIFCGAPSYIHPADQEAPPDYCHESDHGGPEELEDTES